MPRRIIPSMTQFQETPFKVKIERTTASHWNLTNNATIPKKSHKRIKKSTRHPLFCGSVDLFNLYFKQLRLNRKAQCLLRHRPLLSKPSALKR